MELTFGSDPEFILSDEKGKLKSAIGVLPERKKKLKLGDDFFFYDNVLAECTVSPADSSEEAVESVRNSLFFLARSISPFRLTNISAGEFEEGEMNHSDSRKSGCAAENCAYEMKSISPSKVRNLFKKNNFRTAGGHIHIGTKLGNGHEDCIMLVRMLDLFVGVPMMIMDGSPMTSERRRIYGQAGRYRQPEYGLEYRTPGNFWLSSPRLVRLVFKLCEVVIALVGEGIHERFWRVDRERLESDDFWNGCGDPSKCHECHGYDIDLLRGLFSMERNKMKEKIKPLSNLIFRHLPKQIKRDVLSLQDSNFDIYREWGLTTSSDRASA